MKLIDITTKNDQELAALVSQLRTDIATAALEQRTSSVKNIKHLGSLKSSLARALTIERERQIAREEQL